MKLSRQLSDCVMFARWCEREKIDAEDAAELRQLANRAAAAGDRECNIDSDRVRTAAHNARERFERKAGSLGFGVSWPGLYPTLRRAGHDVYLPQV